MKIVMDCQEYREIISAHVDGALSSEEGLAVQSHLNQCPKCTQKFLWETQAKESLRKKLSLLPVRPGLKARLLDRLGETSKEGFFGWSYTHGLAAAFALLLILAVPYLFWPDKVQEEFFTDAISRYQKVTEGIVETPQAPSVSRPARLLDLSPWGYRVLARQALQVKGQGGRAFVYQGQEKEYLLAQEFEGVDFSPPASAEIIRASSREFVSYSQEGVNLVAWKEKDKDLLCILTSNLPKEKLLGLAQQITRGS